MSIKYWLVKSECEVYSIDDLIKEKVTHWDGVRNYQARNYLRDEMKVGDRVLFYHSNGAVPAAVGICEVVKEGYPDFTAFDLNHENFEPRDDPDKPTWFMVDLKFVRKFTKPVPLHDMRTNYKLLNMKLLERGNRLSVIPVEKEEFDEIISMSL